MEAAGTEKLPQAATQIMIMPGFTYRLGCGYDNHAVAFGLLKSAYYGCTECWYRHSSPESGDALRLRPSLTVSVSTPLRRQFGVGHVSGNLAESELTRS